MFPRMKQGYQQSHPPPGASFPQRTLKISLKTRRKCKHETFVELQWSITRRIPTLNPTQVCFIIPVVHFSQLPRRHQTHRQGYIIKLTPNFIAHLALKSDVIDDIGSSTGCTKPSTSVMVFQFFVVNFSRDAGTTSLAAQRDT